MANECAELPGVRRLARPLYRRLFQRPYLNGFEYYGRYDSYAQALADAPSTLPASYDIAQAGDLYLGRHDRIRISDYPVVYWLSQLFASGSRSVFDLGGHIGVSYYGFARYLRYPPDMRWTVNDTDSTVAAGRAWASEHDQRGQLAFADSAAGSDGHDVLLSSGALQYLDYTLADLLRGLRAPPPHILVNLTPMHPQRGYFTLQHIGIAICPYRVMAVPEFVASMQALGYEVADAWESYERHLRVPFEPECSIDCYRGFYFRKGAESSPPATDSATGA